VPFGRWTLDIKIRPVTGDVAHVGVAGEVDLANVREFRDALTPLAGDPAVRLVVCDLAAVPFLACSGLTVLLDVQEELVERGAALRLAAASPAVLRSIHLTGLTDLLPVATHLAD
jgi:anti-anti-sigma factor